MSILAVIAMYALWSSSFALTKMTLAVSPPMFFTGFRMVIGGALLLGFLLFFQRKNLKITKRELLSLFILGVFSVYLTNILEAWGMQYLTSGKGCFIYSLSPFLAALFSYIHFGEKMTRTKWIGMFIGFLGFIPMLIDESGTEGLLHAFSFFSWPELALIGAVACSIYGWVLLRLIVKNQTISPLMANGTSMFLGGIMALVTSFLFESWPIGAVLGPVTQVAPFLKGTLLMMLISNIICYNIYGVMLRKYTATFLSFMGLLSPVFASLHGLIVLREPPSYLIFLATAIVSVGLFIVYRTELKQGYIIKKTVESTAI